MSHTNQPQNDGKRIRHYILICWCDGDSLDRWRFSLINPRTEERRPFPGLSALCQHLAEQLSQEEKR